MSNRPLRAPLPEPAITPTDDGILNYGAHLPWEAHTGKRGRKIDYPSWCNLYMPALGISDTLGEHCRLASSVRAGVLIPASDGGSYWAIASPDRIQKPAATP